MISMYVSLALNVQNESPVTSPLCYLETVHRARFSYDDLLLMICFAALPGNAGRQPTSRSSCRRVK